jgi:hypothetical protein
MKGVVGAWEEIPAQGRDNIWWGREDRWLGDGMTFVWGMAELSICVYVIANREKNVRKYR